MTEPTRQTTKRSAATQHRAPVNPEDALAAFQRYCKQYDRELKAGVRRMRAHLKTMGLLPKRKRVNTSQGPLTEREQAVFDLIATRGPITGKEICTKLGIDQSTLTSRIIPVLKRCGVQNRRGAGYYHAMS